MQKAFLNALAGEAKGDLHIAKKLAGYSDRTTLSEITLNLTEFIKRIAEDILALGSIKAASAIVDSIDNPSSPGVANKINAAKEVLDRVGLGKKETVEHGTTNIGTVFILPPKQDSAEIYKTIEGEINKDKV